TSFVPAEDEPLGSPAPPRSGAFKISNREVGLAILAFSKTEANTAEMTCAGGAVLLNAVVLKLSSYSRPPAKRVSGAGLVLAASPKGAAEAPEIGLPSP